MLPSYPNHAVQMDKTDHPRYWICPISGATFEVDTEQSEKEVMYDKFGNEMHVFKMTQVDGTGG